MFWLYAFLFLPFLIAILRNRRAWPFFMICVVAFISLFAGSYYGAGILWALAVVWASVV